MENRMKLWIAENTKKLMKSKPISELRVSEICQACQIQRTTFYYHFHDKYELVAWIFCHFADFTKITDLDSAAISLAKMKKEISFYRQAYADNGQNALWKYMVDYFARRYEKAILQKGVPAPLPDDLKYQIRLYCYGGVGMTREWVLGNDTRAPREIAQLMFSAMPVQMQKILNN